MDPDAIPPDDAGEARTASNADEAADGGTGASEAGRAANAARAASSPGTGTGTGWRPTPIWYMAEIIVVVVGVIIALAANAWWEGRREATLEAEVRRAVRVELERNVGELRAILEETEACLDRTDQFLRRTSASLAAVPADSTFYWVSGVSCRRTFDPAFGAARALTGAPGFDSVDDLQVRAAVAGWVTAVEDATEEAAALSEQGARVYGELSRYAAAAADEGLAGFPTIPRLVARAGPAVLAELHTDTTLIRAALQRSHYQRAYSQELSEALAAAERALALLADGG